MNTVELDIAYKAFLKVRQEWISTLTAFTQYPVAEMPEPVTRPVALVGAAESGGVETLEKLKHLLIDWQKFHDIAEKFRIENGASPVPKGMYFPVPFIAQECDYAIVTINQGANSVQWYVEKVVGLIKKQISVTERAIFAGSVHDRDSLDDKLLLLQDDLRRFSQLPAGTKLVRRQDGYVDITVNLKDEATLEEVNTVATIFDGFADRGTMRVGQYGVVIQEQALKYKLTVYDRTDVNGEGNPRNVYNRIRPVPCSVLSHNVSLYLKDDVDQAKAQAKEEAKASKREMRKVYSARTHANRTGKAASKSVNHVSKRTKLSQLAEPIDK